MTDDVAAHPNLQPALLSQYATGLGDDCLIMAQRLCEWVTHAPELEEDMALANIGLDLLGQARALISYAAHTEGAGRTEDDFAYLRDEREFRNLQITELPGGDFAESMARLFLFTSYLRLLYERLSSSTDPTLAGIAGKAKRELAYHVDHARGWVVRLGDGTQLSHNRAQAGLENVWPFVHEMFAGVDEHTALVEAGVAVNPSCLRSQWDEVVLEALDEATLSRPQLSWVAWGGRQGIHSEHMGRLLPEMQHVHRAHPGASW
jgi:ring-1,2-phenylacetyl-CoA epoxidase subunit PaaC